MRKVTRKRTRRSRNKRRSFITDPNDPFEADDDYEYELENWMVSASDGKV